MRTRLTACGVYLQNRVISTRGGLPVRVARLAVRSPSDHGQTAGVETGEMSKTWDQLRRRVGKTEVGSADGLEQSLRLRLRSLTPPERTKRASRPALLQPLALLGALLVLVALVGYLSVYERASSRTRVLVATRNLPPGSVLGPADLRVGRIAADKTTMASLVPSRELGDVVGRTLPSGLAAGAPLARAAMAAAGLRPAAFTLVVPALHALGAGLHAGDRVTVLATFETGVGKARTRPLARDLQVLSVGQPPTGLDRASATIAVTVALPDPAVASALALANSAAKIDLLRDSPTGGAAPIPPISEGQ